MMYCLCHVCAQEHTVKIKIGRLLDFPIPLHPEHLCFYLVYETRPNHQRWDIVLRKFQQLSNLQNSVTLVVFGFPRGRILSIYFQKHFFISGPKHLGCKMSLKMKGKNYYYYFYIGTMITIYVGKGMVSELLFTDFSISLISSIERCRTQLQTSFQRRWKPFLWAEPT